MAVFSTNQVRQFYVVKNWIEDPAGINSASPDGSISLACSCFGGEGGTKGNAVGDKEIYFIYKGATDTPLKSDRIQVKNINYVKLATPDDMKVGLTKVKVELNADPIAGQDYVLRIVFRQFYGMSDQDQYIKDAVVHATTGMTKAQFYTEMVKALNLAFSREIGATKNSNPYLTFSSTGGIIIEEKEQGWSLGTQAQERVYFEVFPTTVFDGTDDVIWAKEDPNTHKYYTVQTSTNFIQNGKTIADMEYFYLGERGDQYRLKGWPNNIETKYQVDPTQRYYVLEIHYGFTDTGVNSYRTEKDITLVCTTDILNTVKTEFLKAAGLAEASKDEGGKP